MEIVKVCRVCLIMDVKMYDLQSYPLSTYVEPLLRNELLSVVNSPPLACYECAHLIKKFYFFRQKLYRSQGVLYGLRNKSGQVVPAELKQVDRKGLLLSSNISECTIHVDSVKNNKQEVVVKDERESDNNRSVASDTEGDIKEDVFYLEKIMSSDDEEPLSEQKKKIKDHIKNLKEEVAENVELTSTLNKNTEVEDNNDKLNDTCSPPPVVKKPKQPRKRGVLKKKVKQKTKSLHGAETTDSSVDLGDNVTVLNLTGNYEELNDTGSSGSPPPVVKKPKQPRKREAPKKEVKQKTKSINSAETAYSSADLEDNITVLHLTVEEQIEELNKRKESSNYLNSPYQCELCYKGFVDTNAWKHHVRKHAPSAGDIECQICKFRFKSKTAMRDHKYRHEKKYACKSCTHVSTNSSQAGRHQQWHKGVTHICKICGDIFKVWTSYMSHVRIKHPSEFICGICGYSYVSKLGLTQHNNMMHKDIIGKGEEVAEDGPYCKECDVKFVSMKAFNRHIVMSTKHTISNQTNHGCRTCGECFKNAKELRIHHRKVHAKKWLKHYGNKRPSTNYPTKCEHCSEEVSNGREHWWHYRRAHPDKSYPMQNNYVCDVCGKGFRGHAFLVYHKRIHTQERPYKCDQCDKAFHLRANLQTHQLSHSESRPYPCSVCLKAFKCKGALSRHSKCHTGHKPHKCEFCGKAFTQSNSRKLHITTVHMKQPSPYISRRRARTRHKETLPAQ